MQTNYGQDNPSISNYQGEVGSYEEGSPALHNQAMQNIMYRSGGQYNPFGGGMTQAVNNEMARLMGAGQQQAPQPTYADQLTNSFWNAAAAGNPSGNYNAQGPVNNNGNMTDTNLGSNGMAQLFNQQLNGFGGWGN